MVTWACYVWYGWKVGWQPAVGLVVLCNAATFLLAGIPDRFLVWIVSARRGYSALCGVVANGLLSMNEKKHAPSDVDGRVLRVSRRMSRHVLTTVAVAVLSLTVLGPPVQAQDNLSAQELADLRARAEAGDASAHYNLGVMYATGRGVPQDDAEAVAWYRLAAEQGEARAQYNLGTMYDTGEGVPQDFAEAVTWYRRAAEQSHASAQHNLGVMYYNGRGVPQDYVEAVAWFHRAAEQGVASAQNNLGVMYDTDKGVPQDNVEAHMWLNLAASRLSGADREQSVATRERVAERIEVDPGSWTVS